MHLLEFGLGQALYPILTHVGSGLATAKWEVHEDRGSDPESRVPVASLRRVTRWITRALLAASTISAPSLASGSIWKTTTSALSPVVQRASAGS